MTTSRNHINLVVDSDMPETVRTFLAIPVNASAKLRQIVTELGGISKPVRSVQTSQMHLTLSFLGETPQQQLAEIGRTINTVALRHQAFELEIAGVDAFPSRDRPRVLWAGISPAEGVIAIAEDLRDALEEIGFPRERRAFTPHLTLAYIKGKPPREVGMLPKI